MASGLDKKLNFNAKITQIGLTLIPGRNAFLHPSSHKPLTLSLFLPLPLYSQENSSNLNPWISQPSLDRFWWNLEDMSKIWSRIWFWHWNSRIPPKFHFVLVLKNFVLVLSSCSLASLKQLPYSPLLLFFFFSQLSSFGHTMLQADLLCACNSWPFFTSFSMIWLRFREFELNSCIPLGIMVTKSCSRVLFMCTSMNTHSKESLSHFKMQNCTIW